MVNLFQAEWNSDAMSPSLNQDWLHSVEINLLRKSLKDNFRFVGGCVRNSRLGLPITDIDIATPLEPKEVLKKLEKSGIKAIPTGIEHGTVSAIINKNQFEITTLRSDINCDGRHAQVAFTDNWQEDAARRDFTINAMSCDVNGKIYDYFSGNDDLEKGVVKFIGNAEKRCQEDYLRILRFFRFYSLYGNNHIDQESLKACAKYASNLRNISEQRIKSEMFKMLKSHKIASVLNIMEQNNITDYIFASKINLNFLDNFLDYKKNILNDNDVLLVIICLIYQAESLKLPNWSFSNKEKSKIKQIHSCVNLLNNDLCKLEQKHLIYKFGSEAFTQSIFVKKAIEGGLYENMLNLAENWQIPEFPVSGDDLINIGYKPNKKLGETLKKLIKAWQVSNYKLTKNQLIKLSEISV